MNSFLHKNNPATKPLALHRKAKTFVQPKLTINTPGDQYEQEADAMADRVMRMSSNQTPKPITGLIGESLQRKCTHCEEEEKRRKPVMRKTEAGNPGMSVSSSFASSLNASKGGGSPLPQETKSFMENAFSTDFSAVRLHTDNNAAEMSKGINAKAFTYGSDIYFKEGQYNSNSEKGKHLLGHELAHVLQQSGSKDSRRNTSLEKIDLIQNNTATAQNGFISRQTDMDAGIEESRDADVPIAGVRDQASDTGVSDGSSIPSPIVTTPLGAPGAIATNDITLETGNIGAGFLNNLVHQQICIDRHNSEAKRCFSFAASGRLQAPQFSTTWLGWDSWVTGAILQGEVYEPRPVTGATIVSTHTPTTAQGARWLNYMASTRLGLHDGYSVGRHNCRTFSQWEFRDAPSHW